MNGNRANYDPDTQLMLQVRDGDSEAFSQLFDRYYPKVAQLCFRYTRDAESAEDAAQQVFLKIYQKAADYKPTASFSTYIFRVASNHCMNYIRDTRRHQALSLDQTFGNDENGGDSPMEFIPSEKPSPRDAAISKETRKKVQEAINSLPAKQKMAMILKKFEHLSYEQIGDIMECTPSAVDSLLQRARMTLVEKFKKIFSEGIF